MRYPRIVTSLLYAGVLGTVSGLFQTTAVAEIVNIDFEDVGVIDIFAVPSVTSRGFTFQSNLTPGLGTLFNGANCGPNCSSDGTTTLTVSGFDAGVGGGGSSSQPVSLINALGLPFQLLSFDVAPITGTPDQNADSLEVTGFILGGGTISQVVPVNTIFDPQSGRPIFEPVALNPLWDSTFLSSVDFVGSNIFRPTFNEGFSLDNVRVDVVSEPSTLTLTGIGIIALALIYYGKNYLRRAISTGTTRNSKT